MKRGNWAIGGRPAAKQKIKNKNKNKGTESGGKEGEGSGMKRRGERPRFSFRWPFYIGPRGRRTGCVGVRSGKDGKGAGAGATTPSTLAVEHEHEGWPAVGRMSRTGQLDRAKGGRA